MLQASVHDVHQMRKIQGAIHALGPTPVPAEELSGSRAPQQSFHRVFEIHAISFRDLLRIQNGVNP
jgi:hypothetical protein